jgi:hypothetical protein
MLETPQDVTQRGVSFPSTGVTTDAHRFEAQLLFVEPSAGYLLLYRLGWRRFEQGFCSAFFVSVQWIIGYGLR